jgi:tRNA(Ile)-lysidine synthase
MSISPTQFETFLNDLPANLASEKNLAVAVSGGADSLALAILLSEWREDKNIKLHALTVDHGLRPESAAEAKYVAKTLKPFGISHKTLLWDGIKPKTKIQEAARDARYSLMSEYCSAKKIKFLFLAHHGQDQIETILFRMAKGTGLDGLIGMRPLSHLENGLTLVRPLLRLSHKDLCDTLKSKKIDWIEDPSNINQRYARVRIRNVIDVLENEGLTPSRMSSLSDRVAQSVDLIDYLIDKEYNNMILYKDTQRIEINYNSLLSLPLAGKIRILKQIISSLMPHKKHPARLEDIERLVAQMDKNFRGSTLGKCQFKCKKDCLVILREI